MKEKYVLGMKSLLSSYKMSGMKYFHNPFLKRPLAKSAKIYDPVVAKTVPNVGSLTLNSTLLTVLLNIRSH